MTNTLYTVILLALLTLGCNRDQIQANKSLKGEWNVVAVESIYGNFTVSENGVQSTVESERKIATGDLGTFTFTDNETSYTFASSDSTYSGSNSWTLSVDRVNEGFTKTNKWTLNIGEDAYDVQFEDQTKNAEKKAENIQLTQWPKTSGLGVGLVLKLKKK